MESKNQVREAEERELDREWKKGSLQQEVIDKNVSISLGPIHFIDKLKSRVTIDPYNINDRVGLEGLHEKVTLIRNTPLFKSSDARKREGSQQNVFSSLCKKRERERIESNLKGKP